MEFAVLIAFTALVSSVVAAVIEVFSIRHIDKRLAAESHKFDEKGSVGKQFGDWLVAKEKLEDGTEVTNLELCADVVGRKLYTSLTMGMKGMKSGVERRFRAIENGVGQVLEQELPADQKYIISLAKRVGEAVGFEVAPSEIGFVLEKLGLNKNDGHTGGSQWR